MCNRFAALSSFGTGCMERFRQLPQRRGKVGSSSSSSPQKEQKHKHKHNKAATQTQTDA
jgi:hypothetical protein